MQDDLTRAQRYRALAQEMEKLWRAEQDEKRRAELLGLVGEYRRLADRLINRAAG